MVAIALSDFGGMIPAQDPRLLPNSYAEQTENVWLYNGALRGLNAPEAVHTIASGTKYVYRIPLDLTHPEDYTLSTWMEFSDPDTDVIRSPVSGDSFERYYWTSPTTGPLYNSVARIRSSSSPLTLGVPAPTTFPTVTASGGASSTTQTRVYLFTWVTEFGEEGPPSAPSVATTGKQDDGWTVTITAPTDAQKLNRLIDKVRIYRTVTSSTGVATFFQVTELPLTTLVYIDTQSDTIISGKTQLQSTNWTPPPTDLKGMISMPNGMIAGFRANELWFCEPFHPHAWPAAYTSNTEYPIVGLGVLNQSLLVCTTGFPVLVSGIRPSVISMTKAQVLEPCMSRSSIIGTDAGIFYASQNGLAVASNGRVTCATTSTISREDWNQKIRPRTLRAARLGTAYYALQTGRIDHSEGVLIDAVADRLAFNMLMDDPVTNVMTDIWTGDVLVLKGTTVSRVHPPGGVPQPYTWKSKPLMIGFKRNLSAMQVKFYPIAGFVLGAENFDLEQTLTDQQYGIIKVYADGIHVATREMRESGAIIRLPSGYKAEEYQFEVSARVSIQSINVAPAIKDLRSV